MTQQQNTNPSLRLQKMSESATISMTLRARELMSKGEDVINLSLGLSDLDTPDFIKEAGKKAIDDNFTRYSPVAGYPDLKEAICNKLKRDNGINYLPSQIVVSAGVKHSLANLAISILNPDDEVIVLAPYWISYVEIVKIAGAKPVLVNATAENDFRHSIDDIRKVITPKTRMLWFSTPNNPTGKVLSLEELKNIADLLVEYPNILIVSDEIYEYIVFNGKHESIAQFESIYDRVITVNGMSKGYAMTGWRVGYIACAQWIANACVKMQSQFTSGICSISQRASKEALLAPPEKYSDMMTSYVQRKDLAVSLLSEIDGIEVNEPDGAFFIFLDVSNFYGKSFQGRKISSGEDLCNELLNTEFVAVVAGGAFGASECVRISFVVSENDLRIAIGRIANMLQQLN